MLSVQKWAQKNNVPREFQKPLPHFTKEQEKSYEAFVQERKLADEQQERDALKRFPFESLSPEEYTARYNHTWGCSRVHQWRYRNPRLGLWLLQLQEIQRTPGLIEKCQEKFLTPSELAEIRKREQETF